VREARGRVTWELRRFAASNRRVGRVRLFMPGRGTEGGLETIIGLRALDRPSASWRYPGGTGSSGRGNVAAGQRIGAKGVLAKPFPPTSSSRRRCGAGATLTAAFTLRRDHLFSGWPLHQAGHAVERHRLVS